jgi:hypothetical protein
MSEELLCPDRHLRRTRLCAAERCETLLRINPLYGCESNRKSQSGWGRANDPQGRIATRLLNDDVSSISLLISIHTPCTADVCHPAVISKSSKKRWIPADLVQNTAEYSGSVASLVSFRGVSSEWQDAVSDAVGFLNGRCWTQLEEKEMARCGGRFVSIAPRWSLAARCCAWDVDSRP